MDSATCSSLSAVTSGALFIASFSAVANAISSGMETWDDDASPGAASSSNMGSG